MNHEALAPAGDLSGTSPWEAYLPAAFTAARRAAAVLRRYFRRPDLVVDRKDDGTPVTRADMLAEHAMRGAFRELTPEIGILGEELGQEGSRELRWVIDPIDGTRNFVRGVPYVASLIALESEGRSVLGLVHAPFLTRGEQGPTYEQPRRPGSFWWALRGGGAFVAGESEAAPGGGVELAVSRVERLSSAFLAHGGLRHFQAAGLWERFGELCWRSSRTRGFGDFWGHMMVAEGRCDAMLDPKVKLHDIACLEVIVEEAGGATRASTSRAALEEGYGQFVSTNGELLDEVAAMLLPAAR